MESFENFSFCPPNETIWTIWENHGLSKCLSYTVSSSVLAFWIVVVGASEWWVYRKYGTPLERTILPMRPLYKMQLILTWLLIGLVAAQVVIYLVEVDGQKLYGFNILWGVLMIVSWSWSLYLVHLERCFALPSVPTTGHGLILLIFWTTALALESILFMNLNSPIWFFHLANIKDKCLLALFASRFVVTTLLFILGLNAPGMPRQEDFLLGALTEIPYTLHVHQPPNGCQWPRFRNKVRRLATFVWPKGHFKLQCAVLSCIMIMVAGRFLNPVTPFMQKQIVNGLTPSADHRKEFLWKDILIYVSVMFLTQGTTSVLSNIRSFTWLSVQQHTTKTTQVSLYAHLHDLSLSWHLSRKTGEVLKVLDRGTTSAQSFLSYILFQIIPAFTDIIIAFGYFTYSFNVWFGLIAFACMVVYLVATICITEWRIKFRRAMNLLDNAAQAKGVDALINFETVKYYNAEQLEVDLYAECVRQYQVAERKSEGSLALLNIAQGSTLSAGTLIGALLCAYMIFEGSTNMTPGDYVFFIMYNAQLYSPLSHLGTYYRMIQRSLTDMENMFDLLDVQPEVTDHPGAADLRIAEGQIEFRDVCFSYSPERPILKNVSFTVPTGSTVALVGHTGSGKTTILRLLFRFYDLQSGYILIDGQNIATITQQSLRSHIGVVPQDTVLFNMSIRENIRYGRPDATDDEVERAAVAADMHESIMRMPDKYDTIVGERGLKLSGGEKQRVAIARTILKEPSIVVLDEATSALDTHTERNVQKALGEVIKNKTSIVIAHRLSTIVNANQILVMDNGEIVERGNHKELLAMNQRYASMWKQQQEDERKRSESEAGPSTAPLE